MSSTALGFWGRRQLMAAVHLAGLHWQHGLLCWQTTCQYRLCSAPTAMKLCKPVLTGPVLGAPQESRHRLARSTKRTAAVLQEEMSDGGGPDDMADEMQGGDDDDMEEEVFGEQMRSCTHLSS